MLDKYNIGDYVVYDIFGICKIVNIEKLTFTKGTPKTDYYVLSPLNSNISTYYVPTDVNFIKHKLRLPLSKNEIHQLLTDSKNIIINWIDKRQERNDCSNRILSSGITPELISLIVCFYNKKQELISNGKKFSATDENILSLAEKAVKEEFAFSLGINTDSVGEYIYNFMEK
jgi:RNA polymerase-interacting CarD/CdnL/TRCF family regulator